MTHSLHREGSCESLSRDFVILSMVARQFDLANEETKAIGLEKLRATCGVFWSHSLVNVGSLYVPGTKAHGMTATQIRAGLKANGFVACVAGSRDSLRDTLRDLKQKEIGLSVVVSGLMGEVFAVCAEVGLTPHTIDLSLGVWGNKELLPEAELLEITTMCGHAMVSVSLVKEIIRKVRAGQVTPQKGALELAQPCVCGIFNQERAAELLARLAKSA